jgi:hypothetical protein
MGKYLFIIGAITALGVFLLFYLPSTPIPLRCF